MIHIQDVLVDGDDWQISLFKLLEGKPIVDIQGYLDAEYGDVCFVLTHIVFADGTHLGIEGEHDYPYLDSYCTQPQPNFDATTLARLYGEQYPDELEEEDEE